MPSTTSTPMRLKQDVRPLTPTSESNQEAALILVKAVPRPSKGYQETVCCAGITGEREWRRLYPVRFRQLTAEQQFARWQWVSYTWHSPRNDPRKESRRIGEDTLRAGAALAARDRLSMLLPILRASTNEAAARQESLALIEPRELRLRVRQKQPAYIEAERQAFREAARQQQLLDREVTEFEPCPYAVAMGFTDQDGTRHAPQCGDWETTATFFQMRKRGVPDTDIIHRLETEFTEIRQGRRIFLAMGTVAKRPRQWLLLGVIRVTDRTNHPANQLAFSI